MDVSIDRNAARTDGQTAVGAGHFAVPKPLYSQVRDMLAGQIAAGQWAPGSALPNETVLSQTFGVSIGTIRRAVEGLEDMGIVVRRQGRGTFIAGLGQPAMADKLRRLRSPDGAAIAPTYRVLDVSSRTPTAADLTLFGRPINDAVITLRRSLHVGARIVGLECSILAGVGAGSFTTECRKGRDVYAILADAGLMVIRAEETVSARIADADDAAALSLARGAVLLEVERRACAFNDRLVEVRTSLYVPTAVSYCAGPL